jgi:hypothetical protein
MKISTSVARVAGLAAIAFSVAACASTGPYFAPGKRDIDQRYGNAQPVQERAAPRYGRWSMNGYEREAEKKAIEQDQPFSTIQPSHF